MATNSMVPYSNTAGNNQTTPGAAATSTAKQALPGSSTSTSTSGLATSANPLVPTGTATSSVPSSTSTAESSELDSIFGAGVGSEVSSFLGSISGTQSTVLNDYIKSLAPQMATAQAQTNATLGAGGVSANSSVAALADASLNAQEETSIASESASLTESGLQMQESMIQSMLGPAENYNLEESMMPYQLAGAGIGAGSSIASSLIAKG